MLAFQITNTGLKYKFFIKNDNVQKPELGDVLTIDMTYKIEGADTFLFKNKNKDGIKLSTVKPLYKGDISEGLAMMAIGDSAYFIVNADSFYIKNIGWKNPPAYVNANTNLVFNIKIKSIQTKADYEKEVFKKSPNTLPIPVMVKLTKQ